jgi:hypothetical protein
MITLKCLSNHCTTKIKRKKKVNFAFAIESIKDTIFLVNLQKYFIITKKLQLKTTTISQ